MSLSHAALCDRFRATLLGGAIGDALGFPYEGAAPATLARLPHIADDFALRSRCGLSKGRFSDDTQMMLAVVESILIAAKVDGRTVAACLAKLWAEGQIILADPVCNEAVGRLLKGVPWMSSGMESGYATNSAAVRAAPLGLFHFDNIAKLPRDAENQAVVTHKDARSIAGSMAMAAAIAHSLSDPMPPDTFCLRVAAVVRARDPELASHIERLPQLLAYEPSDAARVISNAGLSPLLPKSCLGISNFVYPSVLMALYACLRARGDFRACMDVVLRAGGDTDSVACMAGAILGAQHGCGALPPRLLKGVFDRQRIVALADALFALKQRSLPKEVIIATASSRHAGGRR
ncbi:MAG: ADP-ribosylglycohydrolase family protein [Myxococcales bacterium]|jgi:ADP-ribosylglycohydrolase|nr:ADP-ribosylglycohydrolase family protein [Myxococcales bacterium]